MYNYRRNPIKAGLISAAIVSILLNLFFIIMMLYGNSITMEGDYPAGPPPPRLDLPFALMHALTNFLLAFFLYELNFAVFAMHNIQHRYKVLLSVCFTIVGAVAFSLICSYISIEINGVRRGLHMMVRGSLFRDCFIAILVNLSTQIMYWQRKQEQSRIENEILKAENLRSKYEALRNQLDPHFLFNSLNTLNGLIVSNSAGAQEYVQHLSAMFRYTLNQTDVTTVRKELDFTRSYCNMMQIRYGDNLKIEINTDAVYDDYLTIPFSVQLLLENAIKHNVITRKYPLHITVMTLTVENMLVVSNPIQPKRDSDACSGFGLKNLSERYKLQFHQDIRINSSEHLFEVAIPLIKPSDHEGIDNRG